MIEPMTGFDNHWIGAIIQKATTRLKERSNRHHQECSGSVQNDAPTSDDPTTVSKNVRFSDETDEMAVVCESNFPISVPPIGLDVTSFLRDGAEKVKQSFSACLRPANDIWELLPKDQTCSGPIIGGQKFEFSVRRTAVVEAEKNMDLFPLERISVTDEKDLLGVEDVFNECVKANYSSVSMKSDSFEQPPQLNEVCKSGPHHHQIERLQVGRAVGDQPPMDGEPTSRSNIRTPPPSCHAGRCGSSIESGDCRMNRTKTPTTINTEIMDNRPSTKCVTNRVQRTVCGPDKNGGHIGRDELDGERDEELSQLESISSKDDGLSISMTEDNSDAEAECPTTFHVLCETQHRMQDVHINRFGVRQASSSTSLPLSLTARSLIDIIMHIRRVESEPQLNIATRPVCCKFEENCKIHATRAHLANEVLGVYKGFAVYIRSQDYFSAHSNAATMLAGTVNQSSKTHISIADLSKRMILAGSRFWDLVCSTDHGHTWLSSGQMIRSCSYTEEDIKKATDARLAFGYWADAESVTSRLLSYSKMYDENNANCGITFAGNYMILFSVKPIKPNDLLVVCDPRDNDNYLKALISIVREKFNTHSNREPLRSSTYRGPTASETAKNAHWMTPHRNRRNGLPNLTTSTHPTEKQKSTNDSTRVAAKDMATATPDKLETTTTTSGGDGESGFDKVADESDQSGALRPPGIINPQSVTCAQPLVELKSNMISQQQPPINATPRIMSSDEVDRCLLEIAGAAKGLITNYSQSMNSGQELKNIQCMQIRRILDGFHRCHQLFQEPSTGIDLLNERTQMNARTTVVDLAKALKMCEKQIRTWATHGEEDEQLKAQYIASYDLLNKYSVMEGSELSPISKRQTMPVN